MFSNATKLTVIAERLLQERIIEMLYAGGAKGHTVFDGSGKGEHSNRRGDRAAVIHDFTIVQLDVVFGNSDEARKVAEDIADTLFVDYAGIVYLTPVEIIRAKRF
ncbi:P-II family nitrogen regulator [Algimonas porphyrae]|uniref:Nitrogen regulatory protein P-II n=1 Tax=Algimonas porphyrae TaxID=1128113 RepID=A0ABQ5V367_9PROT|nr:hypothetical protein [Algimonas porphyrae]GLQ21492.1 hypothetical protein GCM10007854_24470 [Algimonas porphyrae]